MTLIAKDMYRIEPGWWFEGELNEAREWIKDAEEIITDCIECGAFTLAGEYRAKDIVKNLGELRKMLEEAEEIIDNEEVDNVHNGMA